MADWRDALNPEQRAVVEHRDGRLAVLAGAGSGKTFALVSRIRAMTEDGIDPRRILAVTFSRKAADEMNARLERAGIDEARVGTWHSLCGQILREDRTPFAGWTVDEKDRHGQLVKAALGHKHMRWDAGDVSQVRRLITLCKANLYGPEDAGARELARAVGFAPLDVALALEAYRVSETLVEEERLLTFDDMLVRVAHHLEDEANRARWAARWTHVLQDEAQDANRAQIVIAERLTRDHGNYLQVGDPGQAIYSFRGSSPEHLLDFAKAPGTTVVHLARNYRSGAAIVAAGNAAIREGEASLGVDLVAERPHPGSVRVVAARDLDDEGEQIAQAISEASLSEAVEFSSWCILFRTNAQSRAIEAALTAAQIPHVVVGACSFWQRREVSDVLTYLRVAAGQDPTGAALRRCINSPFRFLGPAFLAKVEAHVKGGAPDTEAVRLAADEHGIQRRQRASAEEWAELVDRLRDRVGSERPDALLGEVLAETRYLEWLDKEHGAEGLESSHGANVRELVRVAARFKTTAELLAFVDSSVAASKRRDAASPTDPVLLMSVHRAKGLEWPRVWVVGCNEGILPHAHGDREEERRIFYVAVTRARDELTLSYVQSLATRAGVRPVEPSPFLADAGVLAREAEAAE